MRIDYGPPGHRGVTKLVAVGDAEYDGITERTLKAGTWVAAGAIALGAMSGSRTIRTLGIGGLLAILGVRAVAKPRLRAALPVA